MGCWGRNYDYVDIFLNKLFNEKNGDITKEYENLKKHLNEIECQKYYLKQLTKIRGRKSIEIEKNVFEILKEIFVVVIKSIRNDYKQELLNIPKIPKNSEKNEEIEFSRTYYNKENLVILRDIIILSQTYYYTMKNNNKKKFLVEEIKDNEIFKIWFFGSWWWII